MFTRNSAPEVVEATQAAMREFLRGAVWRARGGLHAHPQEAPRRGALRPYRGRGSRPAPASASSPTPEALL